MTRYYPINLALKNKMCLVIGAGSVALRKVRRLLACGAKVIVISPSATPGLTVLANKGKIVLKRKKAALRDLKGARLVIAATTDRAVNAAVSTYCNRNGILVNVVDSPEECNFILPSIIRRGDLAISISTDGVSPALSKKIRRDLEKAYGAEYAGLLRLMKRMRPQAIKGIKSARARKEFFNRMLQPEILNLIKRNKPALALRSMKRILADAAK